MTETLRRLIDLHRLDEELGRMTDEAVAIPVRRAAQEAEVRRSEERLLGCREALRVAEHARREEEGRLRDAEALCQRLEGQQGQVKTNEAYTALLHEIEAARERISSHETRILELMDEIEAARTALAAAEREDEALRGRLVEEGRGLDAREEFVSKEISRLREARTLAAGGVEADWIARYERTATRRRPVVVFVSKELCVGCRVGIPPQKFVEVVRGTSLVICESCQRILIHERWLAAG